MKAYIYAKEPSRGDASDWQHALFMGVPFVSSSGVVTEVFKSGEWYGFEGIPIDADERSALEGVPSWFKRVITNDAGRVLRSNVGLTGTVTVDQIRVAVLV